MLKRSAHMGVFRCGRRVERAGEFERVRSVRRDEHGAREVKENTPGN